MKDTRDIIENVLRAHCMDYDLADASSVKSPQKSKEIVHLESGSNVLVSEKDEGNGNLDDIETYQPSRKVEVDVNEVKDGVEKKKKKRNYIEFRTDYMKIK